MKTIFRKTVLFIIIMSVWSCNQTTTNQVVTENQEPWSDLMNSEFIESYPTEETTEKLYNEMLFQRASQSVIWSMPAMALWYMKEGSVAQFGEGSNVFPIWKDRLNAKTLVSTPNSDVIYGMGYIDLKKDGPTVIEVPPLLQ
jgi:hypothetical protein